MVSVSKHGTVQFHSLQTQRYVAVVVRGLNSSLPFRKWKENTSTSPSCHHLGHYKSLLPPFKYDLNEYMSSPSGCIMNVHLSLLNFCAPSHDSERSQQLQAPPSSRNSPIRSRSHCSLQHLAQAHDGILRTEQNHQLWLIWRSSWPHFH